MRSLLLFGCLVSLGTGCTIHVVEQPGVPVAYAGGAEYERPARPVRIARHEQARPVETVSRPPRRPTPDATPEPRPTRPTDAASPPHEPRPTRVSEKPRPSTKSAKKPARTVRDLGSRAVGEPVIPAHEDSTDAASQHDRAHDMKR